MIIPARNSGFTLIELSMVILIIGLIAGGILVGRDLIRISELRTLITQQEQFKTATNSFISKYGCMPGDCPNAYDFFSPACGDNTDDAIVGCNGNGNKLVIDAEESTQIGEHLKFWSHLSLAGLIPGVYQGSPITTPYGPEAVPGFNVPLAKMQRSVSNHPLGWNAILCLYIASEPSNIDPLHTNGFCLSGSKPPYEEHYNWYPLLTHEEAYFIDSKIDDGSPVGGKVLGDASYGYGGNHGCAGSDYFNTSGNDMTCSLSFIW